MESTQMSMTIIPKKKNLFIMEDGTVRKKKVAAYARVSTDLEDQKNSFKAQLEEYGKRISENPEWEFVKLYSDEGITGTSLKKREGFNEMIEDALNGKIDLILTKSVSRWARNTVDCIENYRKLRAANVGIYFDKEHINSLEKDVEFQLTLYASMAQEESKTISENVKWGVRSRMKRGDRKMNVKYTLGYRYENNEVVIVRDEAVIVKKIFDNFISGCYGTEIARMLEKDGCLKRNGKSDWEYVDIHRILTDEKYVGMFVMQKTVVKNFLDHKAYKNDGIEDKVILNNHHEEIVSQDNFNYVQILLEKQKEGPENKGERKDLNPMNGLAYCGCCGLPLTKLTTHPGTDYKRNILTCRSISKSSIDYRECDYHEGCTDYELAVKALYEVYDRFFQNERVSADFFKQNIDISITELMEKKYEVDKEIVLLQKQLQAVLTKAITTNSQTNEDDFNKINKQLNEQKKVLDMVLEAIDQFRQLTIDVNHMSHNFGKNEDIRPTNRLIRKVVKMIIRREDGSLRFIVSDTDISSNDIPSLLLLEPYYSSNVKNEKRMLFYDVAIIKGEHNEN